MHAPDDDPEARVLEERLVELEETERQLGHDHYRTKLIPRTVSMQEMTALRDERADLQRKRRKLEKQAGALVLTHTQVASLGRPPASFADAESEVTEFWRSVVRTVFERIEIEGGWKGKRFSEDRVKLVPRPEYEDAAIPLDPARGEGLAPAVPTPKKRRRKAA